MEESVNISNNNIKGLKRLDHVRPQTYTVAGEADGEDVPMTTRLRSGFPPCLCSSSARMLSCCLFLLVERGGVGVTDSSAPHAALGGVSRAATAVTSGLGRLRTDGLTPFSSELHRSEIQDR